MATLASAAKSADDHNPDDILNPSFVDLFVEEAPPEWTLADLQHLSEIRGQPPPKPAPFQTLPVELIEHIAFSLPTFKDVKAMGYSCSIFKKILFESANHLFWYRWSQAAHSMCRWDLGYYRKNRAYQNTIVNQQSGRRRQRCEKCMARAVRGLAFKKKTCKDCWEDVGMAANELYFLTGLDVATAPREYVIPEYTFTTFEENRWFRDEWDLLFFYKPSLHPQISTTAFQISHDSRSAALLAYAKKSIRDMSTEISQIKRNFASKIGSYTGGKYVQREKYYTNTAQDLICPAEVIRRVFEETIIEALGKRWLYRGQYQAIESPKSLYGDESEFCENFPEVECEKQRDEDWMEKWGQDPGNLHDCDIKCYRKKRAAQFKKSWWPTAEKGFVDMLIGEKAISLNEKEIALLKPPRSSAECRERMLRVMRGMLAEMKWVVPGLRGDWTEETYPEEEGKKKALPYTVLTTY